MASTSGWNKDIPSGLSPVALGDDAIRSFKSHMQAWWNDEHYGTDGSSSSAGKHKVGSARVYQGTTSQLSNPTGDGSHRLFHATDTGGLYVANPSTSSWTLLTNSITLTSDNSWSGDQQVGNGSVGELILDPPDGEWKIAGIVSGLSRIAANQGAQAAGSVTVTLVNPGSALTFGDPIFASSDYSQDFGAGFVYAPHVDRSTGSIEIRCINHSSSRLTIGSGSTIRFVGFKSS